MNTFIDAISIILFLIALGIVLKYFINESSKNNEKIITVNNRINEINYYYLASNILNSLFGKPDLYREVSVSAQLVSNFPSKKVDYLNKYFGLVINDETINQLYNLQYLVSSLLSSFSYDERLYAKAYKYLPSFRMSYTSPGGRSNSEYTLILDLNNIDFLIKSIKEIESKQNNASYQRKKMTNELRDYILQRDNYTCQKCGNSRYREPNLSSRS